MARDPERPLRLPRALADDIERWMADEAVSARREPLAERTRRWMRRRRTTVTAAAAAMLVALVGLAVVLAMQARANHDLTAANGRERARFDLAMESIKDVSCRRQPGPSAQGTPVPGAARQAAAGAREFSLKLEALLKDQTDLRSRLRTGAGLWRAGRADGQDRLQIRSAGALPSRARPAARAGAGGDARVQAELARSLHGARRGSNCRSAVRVRPSPFMKRQRACWKPRSRCGFHASACRPGDLLSSTGRLARRNRPTRRRDGLVPRRGGTCERFWLGTILKPPNFAPAWRIATTPWECCSGRSGNPSQAVASFKKAQAVLR